MHSMPWHTQRSMHDWLLLQGTPRQPLSAGLQHAQNHTAYNILHSVQSVLQIMIVNDRYWANGIGGRTTILTQ